MFLKQLIDCLEKLPHDKVCIVGFANPHSYRGNYSELAFEPVRNITIGQMCESAKSALNKTYTGYKGGDYKMNEYTSCYLAEYGQTGEEITITMLAVLTGCNSTFMEVE